MMQDYKRSMHSPIVADDKTELHNTLMTMGMRIRKAVAEGYNVPTNQFQGFNQANTFTYDNKIDYTDPNPQTNPQTRRMPLPNHIEQPPSLTNRYSTFESGSNVSEWGINHVSPAIVTLPTTDGSRNKRKRYDDDINDNNDNDNDNGITSRGHDNINVASSPYGKLTLDEEF